MRSKISAASICLRDSMLSGDPSVMHFSRLLVDIFPSKLAPYTVKFWLERFAAWEEHMAKLMSKSELIQKIADQHPNATRKDIKGVIESLASVGYKELKKTGAFFVPGFAKFLVIKKSATKARKGINPFTKEPTIFKAKPARKVIRARPVKAVKDAVA
jgi:DNA-binding protein HU-beta